VAARSPERRNTASKSAKARKPAQAAPRTKSPKKEAEPTKPTRKALTAPPGMVLEPGKRALVLQGCGFGISQPVFLGALRIMLPDDFDLSGIEPLLAEFAHAPLEEIAGPADAGPEARLFLRIHAWHAAIQRGATQPIHGGCRVWEGPVDADGVREISFAVPSHSRAATTAALTFVIEAIAALAPAGANAEAVLPALREKFDEIWPILRRDALVGTNINRFVEAAYKLGIERHHLWDRLWAYGLGCKRVILNSSLTTAVSHYGVGLARDKLLCGELLKIAGLPLAQGGRVKDADAAAEKAKEIGYPVVVKPADSDGGAGVTTGIEDEVDLRHAFDEAAKLSSRIIVERHHTGQDYRVTVLHGRAIKLLVRRPAGVTGDGASTVTELVELHNQEPRTKALQMRDQRPVLELDEEAQFQLAARGYAADTVVPAGEFVPLRRRGNISAGGTFEVLPLETLHPDNRMLAQNAAVTMCLDIAGIDIISEDPAKSWRETGGIICEVNASPQIGYSHTEEIFVEILSELIGGKGEIPVHLIVVQEGIVLRTPMPEMAAKAGLNAAVWGTAAWIEGGGELGPFSDVFTASYGVLFDSRVTGAAIAMTEKEVLKFGLPVAQFTSIRFAGKPERQPSPSVRQLVEDHTQHILTGTGIV
jgi:cyanophycin synthetase